MLKRPNNRVQEALKDEETKMPSPIIPRVPSTEDKSAADLRLEKDF